MTAPDQIQITHRPRTMTTPRATLTSDDMPPGLLSEDDLRRAWNQQADEPNQWDSLGSDEQLAWAQVQAIDADRAALKAQPEGEGPSAADLLPVEPPNIPTTMAMQYRSAWREGVEDGWREARAILAHRGHPPAAAPAPGENLATDYIDPEHTGQDRELLEVFYRACNSEGGTADEIHLRGIKAVLAALRAAPAAQLAARFLPEKMAQVQQCSDCQSEGLEWGSYVQHVAAGMGPDKAKPIFTLGCVDCSKTLQVVDAEDVATWMNEQMSTGTPSALSATSKITGLAWPQTLGDWNLMGPPNRLGAWRWYRRTVYQDGHPAKHGGYPIEQEVKMDSQLQPMWGSLVEVDNLDGPPSTSPALSPSPATPPAPELGDVAKWHPLWYLVEFLEGHSSFRRQTEPTDELAQILSDSATLLQQQDAELATLKDDGWAKAMTNLVDQIGGDGPSLWEWGASIPTPKKVVEYLREHIDYLEYLGRAQGALTALKVDPVEESERPWEREGWCNEKGDFWAEGMNREGIAEWKQANRNYLGNWMVRCLPHNAIPLPPPQTGEAAELVPVGEIADAAIDAIRAVPLPATAPVVEWPHCGYEGEMVPAPQAGDVEA